MHADSVDIMLLPRVANMQEFINVYCTARRIRVAYITGESSLEGGKTAQSNSNI